MQMEDVSRLDDVGLLVRLDAADEKNDSLEYVNSLTQEAKRRGFVIYVPLAPESPIGRQEFCLVSVSWKNLETISELVTRSGHVSYMNLHDAVLREYEERKPTKAKCGDTIHHANGKASRIVSTENGVVLMESPGEAPRAPAKIENLEPSPKHGRGHWIVNPKL